MPRLFPLRIVSPDHVVFEGRVQSVVAPGSEGSFGVLFEHAPLLAELGTGGLKLVAEQGEERFLAISGGFLEVSPFGEVSVLADAAEAAEQIDVSRAQAARQRAAERLAAKHDVDEVRAGAALRRALNRLHVAERAH
jgi:F-type H+-transporting ATPase subunit epsilon